MIVAVVGNMRGQKQEWDQKKSHGFLKISIDSCYAKNPIYSLGH